MPSASASGGGSSARKYGGVSADERRASRRQKMFDAGLELFGTRGVAKVTVDDLCAEAGLTKRYFYEQFSSLDEFTDALVESLMATLFERSMHAAEGVVGIEVVLAQIRDLAEAFRSDPRLARLLLMETFSAGGSLSRHREASWRSSMELLLRDVPAFERGGFALDPVRIPMFAAAITGALTLTFASWAEGGVKADLADVTDFLTDFVASAAESARRGVGQQLTSSRPRRILTRLRISSAGDHHGDDD